MKTSTLLLLTAAGVGAYLVLRKKTPAPMYGPGMYDPIPESPVPPGTCVAKFIDTSVPNGPYTTTLAWVCNDMLPPDVQPSAPGQTWP